MLSIFTDPAVVAGLLAVTAEVVRLLHSVRSARPAQPEVIVVVQEPRTEEEEA